MIGPTPQDLGRPGIFRALLAGGLLAGVAVAVALSVTPVPEPASILTQVTVVHDSLHPTTVTPPDLTGDPIPPQLQAAVSSTLDGVRVDSRLYRAGRDRVSLHEVHGAVDLPRNAHPLDVAGRDAAVFEIGDLQYVSWTDAPDRTWIAVGDLPVPRLRVVAEWARSR